MLNDPYIEFNTKMWRFVRLPLAEKMLLVGKEKCGTGEAIPVAFGVDCARTAKERITFFPKFNASRRNSTKKKEER